MKCLRCGNCCKTYLVMIIDKPELGLKEDNIICHKGNGPCKHLIGNKPGEYSCAVHNYPWYKKTPCFDYGQIEQSKDNPCRVGAYILNKEKLKNDTMG